MAVCAQTSVARVVMPVGLSSRVAVSSFMASRNTRANAAARAGKMIGRVTRQNAVKLLAPRVRAASSSVGDALFSAVRTGAWASGRNSSA
ncbi:hypothetical protein D3C71_1866250 [compost metagenome]